MTDLAKPKKVLFVDDTELDIRRFRAGMARVQRTYESYFASDVAAALGLAHETQFDAAIIDLRMPSGSLGDPDTQFGSETGYVLAGKIISQNPNIHIIILSNDRSANDLEADFRESLNIRHIFSKTEINPVDLIRKLDHIFGIKSSDPNIFLVHGHDRSLVNFVQDTVE